MVGNKCIDASSGLKKDITTSYRVLHIFSPVKIEGMSYFVVSLYMGDKCRSCYAQNWTWYNFGFHQHRL